MPQYFITLAVPYITATPLYSKIVKATPKMSLSLIEKCGFNVWCLSASHIPEPLTNQSTYFDACHYIIQFL